MIEANLQLCSDKERPSARASNTAQGNFILSLSSGGSLTDSTTRDRSSFGKRISADVEQPYYRMVFQSGSQKSGVNPGPMECKILGDSQFYVVDDGKGTDQQTLFDCASDYDVRVCASKVRDGDVVEVPEGATINTGGEIEFVLGGEAESSEYCSAKDSSEDSVQSSSCSVTAKTHALLMSTVCNEEGKCLTLKEEVTKGFGGTFGNNRYVYNSALDNVRQIYLEEFVESYCAEGKLDDSYLDLKDECDAASKQQARRQAAIIVGSILGGISAVALVGYICGPRIADGCSTMIAGLVEGAEGVIDNSANGSNDDSSSSSSLNSSSSSSSSSSSDSSPNGTEEEIEVPAVNSHSHGDVLHEEAEIDLSGLDQV